MKETPFTVESSGRRVPGLLWLPEGPARALVLAGHGASGHKRQAPVVVVARRLVREGIAVAAIDGPVHGERRPDPEAEGLHVRAQFATEWRRPGITDEMVADWRAALDHVQKLPEVGVTPVGYWGLSMGSIFGIPLVAAEPRIRVAVLGLLAAAGPSAERIRTDAARITCPVFFVQQWHDELFAREDSSALFDAIASPDKRLHANPGAHMAVPGEELAYSAQFLARHLSRSTDGDR